MTTMDQRSYSPYIVASRSHTLYIGVTGNLRKRIFEHKWREHDGFTQRYHCDRLVWFECFQEVAQAITREKQLKGWRRDKKIALIENTNPARRTIHRTRLPEALGDVSFNSRMFCLRRGMSQMQIQ
jgi:putative endonuclease